MTKETAAQGHPIQPAIKGIAEFYAKKYPHGRIICAFCQNFRFPRLTIDFAMVKLEYLSYY
ncbi:hypothetical protein [Acinetobacter baumannii]|uniref:hypothetical protein n=1 Tax=Acinetobacter baumannii TaxID=470 RepID=UPI00035FA78D|nr:hypothetical protein [Acinetobacter baumannii]